MAEKDWVRYSGEPRPRPAPRQHGDEPTRSKLRQALELDVCDRCVLNEPKRHLAKA